MGLFANRITSDNKTQIPVWFMRQAGRYHGHYQNIRKNHDFMNMCKNPQLATEITMGPIDEFDFDAAILFSDLLFPLEYMGMGLSYLSGPPTLEFHLTDDQQFNKLKMHGNPKDFFNFQKLAIELLKTKLPKSKDLLGFVGGPFTLFTYATCGSHAGSLVEAKKGFYNGRFNQFCEILIPMLLENMYVQAAGGADVVCIFDTAAGELAIEDYKKFIVPQLQFICQKFKEKYPKTKITYYAKGVTLDYFKALENPFIDTIGIDWRLNLADALNQLGGQYYIQGNIDPCWLHLEWNQLELNLSQFFSNIQSKTKRLDKWICGLGHGVLIQTPQDNVKKTVKYIHQNFRY